MQIENDTAQDRSLSFRARGLLTFVLSMPPDWRATTTELADYGTEGRDAVRAAVRELSDAGYVVRTRCQDERGHWTTDTVWHEVPAPENPSPVPPAQTDEPAGRTDDGIPGTGKPAVKQGSKTGLSQDGKDAAAAPPAAGADGRLFDAPSSKPERSAESARATAITRTIYDARDPKPTAPFVGVVQIVKSLLAAGWPEPEIVAAGTRSLAMTRNSFEVELNKNRQPKPTRAAPADSGAAFDQRMRDFANRRNGRKPPTGVKDPIDVKEGTPR